MFSEVFFQNTVSSLSYLITITNKMQGALSMATVKARLISIILKSHHKQQKPQGLLEVKSTGVSKHRVKGNREPTVGHLSGWLVSTTVF